MTEPTAGSSSLAERGRDRTAEKERQLQALRAEALRQGIEVFGEGNADAPLMLVGEAPGREEVRTGRPFQGPAGKVLDRLLELVGISRRQLWITNLVKTRPVRRSGQNEVNRPPRAAEIAAHRWILQEEIRIIRPRVILCLGATAASALIHPNFRIGEERGRRFPGPDGSWLMATFHPSYLLRLEGPAYESARDAMVADLLQAWAEATEG